MGDGTREGLRRGTVPRRGSAVVVLAAALVACDGGCPLAPEVRVTELSSVAQALELGDDVEAIRFTGEARRDMAGLHRRKVRGQRDAQPTHVVVALVPVVPPGWTAADPVPLWIRVEARGRDPQVPIDEEIDALVAALVAGPIEVRIPQRLEADVDMDGTNAFQIATRNALNAHGLHSPVGTPLGTWPLVR